MGMPAHVVATMRPWNISTFHSTICAFPGTWHLIDDPAKLTSECLREVDNLNFSFSFHPLSCGEVPSSTGYLKPEQWEPISSAALPEGNVKTKLRVMQSYKGGASPSSKVAGSLAGAGKGARL